MRKNARGPGGAGGPPASKGANGGHRLQRNPGVPHQNYDMDNDVGGDTGLDDDRYDDNINERSNDGSDR